MPLSATISPSLFRASVLQAPEGDARSGIRLAGVSVLRAAKCRSLQLQIAKIWTDGDYARVVRKLHSAAEFLPWPVARDPQIVVELTFASFV